MLHYITIFKCTTLLMVSVRVIVSVVKCIDGKTHTPLL